MQALAHYSGRDWVDVVLVSVTLALFTTEHLVHYPIGIMSVLGVIGLIRHKSWWQQPAAKHLLVVFCAVWLPMLVASFDAVAAERSWKTTLLYIHFLPAAFYLVELGERAHVLRLITHIAAVLILVAALDAFTQLIWGYDWFGYPYENGILKGVFYPKQRLGLFLAVFVCVYIDVLRQWCHRFPGLWIVLVPVVIVLLMTLKRSAWLMFVAGVAIYFLIALASQHGLAWRRRLLQGGVIAIVVTLAVAANPTLRQQVQTTAGIFSGESAAIDEATSYRWSLWRTGANMFADNWLNGVGPRGYRHAYVHYAPADDFWIARSGGGQTHPHWQLLEIGVESGLLGLLGFAFAYALLLYCLFSARRAIDAPVWLMAALVAWLPLNAHLAFYGSYWSSLSWLMLGLGFAQLRRHALNQHSNAAHG